MSRNRDCQACRAVIDRTVMSSNNAIRQGMNLSVDVMTILTTFCACYSESERTEGKISVRSIEGSTLQNS